MKYKKFIPTLLLALLSTATASSQNTTFTKETFSDAGISLPYRKGNIPGDGDKAALVIYLHGGSSKGNDNETQMNEPGINSINAWLMQHRRKAIMLVPQCPKDKSWIGSMLDVLRNLLQSYVDKGVANDVYIFGGSMGGTGTWNMLANYPDLFTAAMPVAGNPTGLNAENISMTPLYTVMGTADKIMKIQPVETMLSEMDTYEASYMFDIEQGWTHEDVCKKSYTTERLNWVFAHKSDTPDGINATEEESANIINTEWYDMLGRPLQGRPHDKGVYLKRTTYSNGSIKCMKTIIHTGTE